MQIMAVSEIKSWKEKSNRNVCALKPCLCSIFLFSNLTHHGLENSMRNSVNDDWDKVPLAKIELVSPPATEDPQKLSAAVRKHRAPSWEGEEQLERSPDKSSLWQYIVMLGWTFQMTSRLSRTGIMCPIVEGTRSTERISGPFSASFRTFSLDGLASAKDRTGKLANLQNFHQTSFW